MEELIPSFKVVMSKHGYEDIIIPYNLSKFSGGELNIRIGDNIGYVYRGGISFIGSIRSSNDIMELLLLKDAISRLHSWDRFALALPYVPYARQDRVCNIGESLSIKVLADLINYMNFGMVLTYDNHSDVSTALLNNCECVHVSTILQDYLLEEDYYPFDSIVDFLISPDAGANKKVSKVSDALSIPMIRADKTRNVETGYIDDVIVYSDELEGKSVMIVDDICDGGRTFIGLAQKLREKGALKVILYVTHGIFSQGTGVLFDNGIDHIITTDSRFTNYTDDSRITVIKL